MSGVRIGVLALQGDVREHCRVLADLGATPVEVRTPSDLDSVERLILPGGESTTVSLLLRSSGLREPLEERLRGGMPAFGTCAGMILLGSELLDARPDQEPLGAIDIAVRRNAFGRQVDSFETDLELRGADLEGGPPLHAVFIRAPLVERAGPDVEVLAATPDRDGVTRPVVCRQGPVLVSAFHPELTGDVRLHALFVETPVPAGT